MRSFCFPSFPWPVGPRPEAGYSGAMPGLYPMPRAAVFDFDGTIADTGAHIVRSYQETFRRLGAAVPEAHRIVANIGVPLQQSFPSVAGTVEIDTAAELAGLLGV